MLPGRRVPIEGRSGPVRVESRRRRRRRAARVASISSTDLNRVRRADDGDPEIDTRIASYEMAYRMQTSVPELTDISERARADPRDVRHAARQGLVREQLPAGAAARRARRPLRAALSPRLGHARRERRHRHRDARSPSSAARPIAPRPRSSATSSSAACSTRRSSSGAASSAARR